MNLKKQSAEVLKIELGNKFNIETNENTLMIN